MVRQTNSHIAEAVNLAEGNSRYALRSRGRGKNRVDLVSPAVWESVVKERKVDCKSKTATISLEKLTATGRAAVPSQVTSKRKNNEKKRIPEQRLKITPSLKTYFQVLPKVLILGEHNMAGLKGQQEEGSQKEKLSPLERADTVGEVDWRKDETSNKYQVLDSLSASFSGGSRNDGQRGTGWSKIR